jgi:hypothetical protein
MMLEERIMNEEREELEQRRNMYRDEVRMIK